MNILPVTSDAFEVTANSWTLTAAAGPSTFGFDGPTGYGSIDPATLNGATILLLVTGTSGAATTYFSVAGTVAQDFFTSLEVNSMVFNSASATFATPGGFTIWEWAGNAITAATTYPVTIA